MDNHFEKVETTASAGVHQALCKISEEGDEMSIAQIRRYLKGRLEEATGGSEGVLPRTHSDDFKYFMLGLFNDLHDETGYPAFGLRTKVTEEGAIGQVDFGWEVEGKYLVGLRLAARANPYDMVVSAVPLGSGLGMDSRNEDLDTAPTFIFEPDGSNYQDEYKRLVRFLRTNIRPR